MAKEQLKIVAAPSIDEQVAQAAQSPIATRSTPCSDCRKLRRELKERDTKIERLLAALRRESHSIDQRVGPSGYASVILKSK